LLLSQIRDDIVNCTLCPRLRVYCEQIAREKKAAHRNDEYWGRPVPGFGDPAARVLVLGLAPAAHGGNRTGRTFTGDGSGDFLMRAMHVTGFANIPTSQSADDGLVLTDAYIVAAVRCAPPANKPTPAEIARCQPHLERELEALSHVKVVVALGRIAADAYWRVMTAKGLPRSGRPAFAHGVTFVPTAHPAPALVQSYHPSRQNTNTRRLTPDMLEQVFWAARRLACDR
jgi:uracil-DNA glycosylase